ncbi:MAG: hypothetical protein Kow0062_04120 [Acidobacteriota bacterium]
MNDEAREFRPIETIEDPLFGESGAADAVAVDGGPQDRWQIGIVPPNGPLPLRFGMPAALLSGLRLVVALVVVLPLVMLAGGIDPEKLTGFSWGDLAAPLGALLLVLLQRLAGLARGREKAGDGERGARLRPLAVVLEPAGVTLVRLFGSRSLSWSDLTAVRRRDDGGWEVLARRGETRLVVELPSIGWGNRLGRMLSGASS